MLGSQRQGGERVWASQKSAAAVRGQTHTQPWLGGLEGPVLRLPSRPFLLQGPGRAPPPPPPCPDLLRWGRGVSEKSAEQAARPPWAQRRLARDATPEPPGLECSCARDAPATAECAESRAPALGAGKLRAPVAPERPGGGATPSSEAPPRSSLLPWSRAAPLARPTPSSWRQPNGEEHHRPPGETRGRMDEGRGPVAPDGVPQ